MRVAVFDIEDRCYGISDRMLGTTCDRFPRAVGCDQHSERRQAHRGSDVVVGEDVHGVAAGCAQRRPPPRRTQIADEVTKGAGAAVQPPDWSAMPAAVVKPQRNHPCVACDPDHEAVLGGPRGDGQRGGRAQMDVAHRAAQVFRCQRDDCAVRCLERGVHLAGAADALRQRPDGVACSCAATRMAAQAIGYCDQP